MIKGIINEMVRYVQRGCAPVDVLESVVYSLGMSLKVNKATTGQDPTTGAAVPVPEGTVVTVIGVGGGSSGADQHVQLPDGRKVVLPFRDLGESRLLKRRKSVREQLVGAVMKVVLSKPLPASAVEWLEGGYVDYGVELPDVPSDDSASAVTFLMKADDEDMLNDAIVELKKIAGTSFKSSSAATMVDWSAMMAG